MAYVTYYIAHFHQHLNEELLIQIQRKDGVATPTPEVLDAVDFKTNTEADGDSLYAPILRRNIELVVNLDISNTVTWETFFDQVHDEWRIIVTNDSQHIFTGFMLPDEGLIPFEDRPYDLTIRAADGLALLKNVALKQPDGTDFHGKYTLIEYIAACLFWTGLELPIKIYCDLFHSSMDDRDDAIENDMFGQAKLDHRTFMKSATEFVSCFEALEIIFKEHFRIHQDYDLTTNEQVWTIDRIPQYQYVPSAINYYTLYDFDGTNPVGYEDHDNYAEIGKLKLIYKTNEVSRSGKFAVKKTRTNFKYNVWPELPLNNKFERGTFMGTAGPVSTYTIDDWTYGAYRNQPAINAALPAVPVTTADAYRWSEYNVFGIEILRQIVLEGVPATGSPVSWGILMSTAIPVNAGDLFKVSFEYKASYSASGPGHVAMIFVKTSAGIKYFIEGFTNLETSPLRWKQDFGNTYVQNMWQTGTSTINYSTINIEPPAIPVDGELYISILAPANTGHYLYMKSFNVEYTPMVAGGYIPVKGDYWEHAQDANYIDVTENEIGISDSLPRAVKGNILREDGLTATSPSWYRYGLPEIKHYKELANQGRYNTEYRRFMKFQGTFTSTKASPANDPGLVRPLSFHMTYKLMDLPEQPECVLVAPLTIDYKEGRITAIFEEVRRPSGVQLVETLPDFMIRAVAAINSTPIDVLGWDSASNAPAVGTNGFPPIAAVWANVPNTINVAMNDADNMTATFSIGSGGNSPSITEIYNQIVGSGFRLIQYTFGIDIAIGNTFTFTAYGHAVNVLVQATTNASNDGRQTGDSSTFNYLFE